jgi:biotin-(acetyl-CoA carboxylase) ligase
VVIGIGVNILKGSIPPTESLLFPATNLEDELGYAPERLEILHDILAKLVDLRSILGADEFIVRWQSLLAFQGEAVQVETGNTPPIIGDVTGLESDGSLQLRNEHGESITVRFGDVRLRPLA